MTSLISDQKKRALDALERRFAFDKAKIVQQEEKMNKKIKTNPKHEQEVVVADSGDNPPSVSSSSRKGEIFSWKFQVGMVKILNLGKRLGIFCVL